MRNYNEYDFHSSIFIDHELKIEKLKFQIGSSASWFEDDDTLNLQGVIISWLKSSFSIAIFSAITISPSSFDSQAGSWGEPMSSSHKPTRAGCSLHKIYLAWLAPELELEVSCSWGEPLSLYKTCTKQTINHELK